MRGAAAFAAILKSIEDERGLALLCAPMAGISDRAFRTLAVRHGARLTYSEMVSAKGLFYAGAKTWELTEPAPEEGLFAVQLFGSEPDIMASQAAAVTERLGERLALLDVNMGCPVTKVVKKGEGSALIKAPELAASIIEAMVREVDVPVTAKIRSGWAVGAETCVGLAQALEAAGVAGIGVHGRSATQMYRGQADWGAIARVKAAVAVPVIGSGDVKTYADACRMRQETGCDAVFAARGARGNPWIFEGREPTLPERLQAAEEHLDLYIHFNGNEYLSPLRAQLAFYIQGAAHATDIRRALGAATSEADFRRIFAEARA